MWLCALSPWVQAERESNGNQMFVILFDASPEKCSDNMALEQSLEHAKGDAGFRYKMCFKSTGMRYP